MRRFLPSAILVVAAMLASGTGPSAQNRASMSRQVPTFRVDPFWPKTLPEQVDPRRRGGRGGRFARSRVDDASSVDAAAERNAIDLESGAAGARVRCGRDARLVVGRSGHWIRLAAARTRHPHRRQGQRVARRGRRKRRAHPEVHARREVPDADREAGAEQRAATTRRIWARRQTSSSTAQRTSSMWRTGM